MINKGVGYLYEAVCDQCGSKVAVRGANIEHVLVQIKTAGWQVGLKELCREHPVEVKGHGRRRKVMADA